MAFDVFIAGAYTQTYNAVDVGITSGGIELQQDSKAEMIDETDVYGNSIIDFIYRGGDVFLQYESKAYKAGSTTPFWPWGSLGVMSTSAAPIGRLASDVAASTVLTATANTPAAATPATLTSTKTILAPNSPARLLFHSRLRNVPIRLLCLPISSSGIKWFTTTVLLFASCLSLLF